MNCSNCGSTVSDDSSFCPKCGQALSRASGIQREVEAASARNSLTSELTQLYNYFSEKRAEFDRMFFLCSRIGADKATNQKTTGLVVSIIVAIIALSIIAGYLSATPQSASQTQGNETLNSVALIIFLSVFCGPLFVPLIVSVSCRVSRKRRIPRDTAELKTIYQDLYSHYLAAPNTLAIAYEYADPYTIYAIEEIIRLGKADSVKEAIQRMDEAQYHSQMLNMQGQILEEAHGARVAAQTAASLAGLSAAAAGVAAIRR